MANTTFLIVIFNSITYRQLIQCLYCIACILPRKMKCNIKCEFQEKSIIAVLIRTLVTILKLYEFSMLIVLVWISVVTLMNDADLGEDACMLILMGNLWNGNKNT